ncbi:MAG: Polysaccharide biosynthesis protein, partial [Candidatus Daviesbacteria bacterium GW2011_GWF2_38_7]
YSQSIPVIKILSLAIPFMFIHAPAVSLLLSTDKYLKDVLILSVLAVSFNIIANLIFIPKYGLFAAAYVTVLSEILSFVVFFLLIKKRILDKT